jgi:hypothetical protein
MCRVVKDATSVQLPLSAGRQNVRPGFLTFNGKPLAARHFFRNNSVVSPPLPQSDTASSLIGSLVIEPTGFSRWPPPPRRRGGLPLQLLRQLRRDPPRLVGREQPRLGFVRRKPRHWGIVLTFPSKST